MKILKVEPGKTPVEAEISGSLESMQAVVGGTIQAIYPFEEPAALICNDESKLLGLPLNRALYAPGCSAPYDIISGTFFLCGAPTDSERFSSLTPVQLKEFEKLFHTPEIFVNMGDCVFCLPAVGKSSAKFTGDLLSFVKREKQEF